MANLPSTITDVKKAFLIDQVRLLSSPLRIDDDWQIEGGNSNKRARRGAHHRDGDTATPVEEDDGDGDGGGLKEKVVLDVLHKGISLNPIYIPLPLFLSSRLATTLSYKSVPGPFCGQSLLQQSRSWTALLFLFVHEFSLDRKRPARGGGLAGSFSSQPLKRWRVVIAVLPPMP